MVAKQPYKKQCIIDIIHFTDKDLIQSVGIKAYFYYFMQFDLLFDKAITKSSNQPYRARETKEVNHPF